MLSKRESKLKLGKRKTKNFSKEMEETHQINSLCNSIYLCSYVKDEFGTLYLCGQKTISVISIGTV